MTPTNTWLLAVALLFGVSGCPKEEESSFDPISFDDDDDTKKTKKKAAKKTKKKKRKAEPKTGGPSNEDSAAIEAGDVTHLRARSASIHRDLVKALPSSERRLVENVPFMFSNRTGEVNAFAACTRDGSALIALTDGLMQVQSQVARASANDEVFGTNKLDAYLKQIAKSAKFVPSKRFISSEQDEDPRKRALQAKLLDEGLAFVIGHELAHHRLSHTGCIGSDRGKATAADVGRLLSRKVPWFNQPNELASDVYGTENLLRAGKDNGHGWTEGGALLMLRAFRARSRLSLRQSLEFGFERTHPPPDVRIPVVQQTARTWRLTGGRSLPKLPNVPLEGLRR